ncbi:hypothetical protein BDZ97DRAFT_2057772 [Flammula alnicola]|nr:hypothetical protein BDZ97DRAFT_2057772 [Flammula alnicola]
MFSTHCPKRTQDSRTLLAEASKCLNDNDQNLAAPEPEAVHVVFDPSLAPGGGTMELTISIEGEGVGVKHANGENSSGMNGSVLHAWVSVTINKYSLLNLSSRSKRSFK